MRDKCPTCGAKIREYKHVLNRSLIEALDHVAHYPGGVNIAGILSHNQTCNFHKLKYWELAEKCGEEGTWKITRRGVDFLMGRELLSRTVVTFRGEWVRYEGELVSSTEYIDARYWRRIDYARNSQAVFTDETGDLFGAG